MCRELANSKFGGELSNKYSNIIGVQTSVYKPSAVTSAPPTPIPVAPVQTKGYDKGYDKYPYPSDIIYPYPAYPYPAYPYYPPLANQGIPLETPKVVDVNVTEKVTEKSVTPTPTAVVVTQKSSPIKTGLILIGIAALVFSGYKYFKK